MTQQPTQLPDKLTYKRTLSSDILSFAASGTTSTLLDCGGMQPRALLFPSNWTACAISLYGAIVNNSSAVYQISNIDGSTLAIATTAGQWLPILPYLTDAVPYLQIVCSIAQSSADSIIVVLEPIYQGIHG
jgi:hypothetical protein